MAWHEAFDTISLAVLVLLCLLLWISNERNLPASRFERRFMPWIAISSIVIAIYIQYGTTTTLPFRIMDLVIVAVFLPLCALVTIDLFRRPTRGAPDEKVHPVRPDQICCPDR